MNIWQWFKVKTITPNISKGEALSIAQIECEKRGWPWWQPIIAKSKWGIWEVWTNADERGGNVRILIKKDTGEVIKASLLPR